MHARSRASLTNVGFLLALVSSVGWADGPPTVKLDLLANGTVTNQLPASGEFFATQAFSTVVEEARLEVWPLAVEQCDEKVNFPKGMKQAWSLTMELTTTEGKSTGKALVPHIQLDEAFCFRVKWTELSSPPASRLTAVLEYAFDWNLDLDFTAKALLAAAQKDFCGSPGKDPCWPVDVRPLASDLAPFKLAGLEVTTEVDKAQKRLEAVAKTISTLEQQLPSVPSAFESKLPSTEWLKTADTNGALQTLETKAVKQALGPTRTDEVKKWLLDWKDAKAKQTALNASITKHEAEWEAKKALAKEQARDVALAFVRASVRASHKGVTSGTAKSADFKNYLSPEFGLAVAQLLGPLGVGSTPRLLPYAAVNVYFHPIERSLGLCELLHPFWQLVSLTLGLSLSTPLSAHDLELSPTIASAYGLVGVGVRVLPFARFSALVFFAEAKRSSGLSEQTAVVVAGALAISADLDVVAFISTQLKK